MPLKVMLKEVKGVHFLKKFLKFYTMWVVTVLLCASVYAATNIIPEVANTEQIDNSNSVVSIQYESKSETEDNDF